MLGQFLIILREGFEAAFIISIILAYLARTRRHNLSKYVWYGVGIAIIVSLIIGSLAWLVYGSLSKQTQTLFEGVAAWLAVAVLSYMIFWMATKRKLIRAEIQKRVEVVATHKTILGLIFLAFVLVFREGVESVLFLLPFLVNEPIATLVGSFLGALLALILAYIIFITGMRINIQRFFYFTSILLVLLAGGLAGYGVHELIEYSELSGMELSWIGESAYALDISSESLFHHKGIVGSIFAVMFGYTVSAEWARVIIHLMYIAIALPIVLIIYRNK
ncbi:MAG: FTR1 family protein [Candidatus Bathyarchaeota archaeon]|nr:FTR1 family protein [Candidatus Bathyarchaeota archaeon]